MSFSPISEPEKSANPKVGMPPGSLIYTGEKTEQKSQISYFSVSDTGINTGNADIDKLQDIKYGNVFTWIEVKGLNDISFIEKIGAQYGIHKMWLEDLLNVNQLASFDELDTNNFLSIPFLKFNRQSLKFEKEQVSLFFNEKVIISFQESGGDNFKSVADRLQANPGKYAKRKPTYLAYAILDLIVDSYLDIIQILESKIDKYEYQIETNPNLILKKRIYHFRRDCILFIRHVNPIQDVVHKLKSSQSLIGNTEIKVYLTDLYNHAKQVIHSADTLKDMLYNLTELFHEEINYRTNVVIKILTVITTIFNPLTFLVGVYGMNFQNMPELKTRYGYYFVWLALITIAVGTFLTFKKRKWI